MHKSIHRRRIAALLLMLPLLWLQAIKFSHSHDLVEPVSAQHSENIIFKITDLKNVSSHCSICEYQIAKAAGLHDLNFGIHLSFFYSSCNSFSESFNSSFFNGITSDRAPPALLI